MITKINPSLSEKMVWAIRKIDQAVVWLTSNTRKMAFERSQSNNRWPISSGAYQLGDPQGSIAVCTLTSQGFLSQAAAIPGVAIAGRLYTANLGIEKMVRNILANPRIRFLIICGKESPFFAAGQALLCLHKNGAHPDGIIPGAEGHYPLVNGLTPAQIERFQMQIELIDMVGVTTPTELEEMAAELSKRDPGVFLNATQTISENVHVRSNDVKNFDNGFTPIKPWGKREPLSMDPKGFFIISVERKYGEIVVHHYHANHQPAHIIQGRNAEAILLGLLREGLVSQMSHAGYLSAELTKAETALRLNLSYEQDQPLRIN